MEFIYTDRGYEFDRDNGETIILSPTEINYIRTQLDLMSIRSDVEYVLRDMIDDEEVDISAYDGDENDLANEVMTVITDKRDLYEDYNPDTNEIRDIVAEVMEYYENNRED